VKPEAAGEDLEEEEKKVEIEPPNLARTMTFGGPEKEVESEEEYDKDVLAAGL